MSRVFVALLISATRALVHPPLGLKRTMIPSSGSERGDRVPGFWRADAAAYINRYAQMPNAKAIAKRRFFRIFSSIGSLEGGMQSDQDYVNPPVHSESLLLWGGFCFPNLPPLELAVDLLSLNNCVQATIAIHAEGHAKNSSQTPSLAIVCHWGRRCRGDSGDRSHRRCDFSLEDGGRGGADRRG